MPSPTEISVSQLSRLIGTPNAPVIIDARIDDDFADDPRLLPTAFRHAYNNADHIVEKCRDRQVVIYCQKGFKICQGFAAILRDRGIRAETLAGGLIAWREAGELMIPAAKLPPTNAQGQTVWVTRHRPKIDRIACPWLIRRFVDPNAQFLFVAPSEVLSVAEKFAATPFDVEEVYWSHRDDLCTFDVMLKELRLSNEALLRLSAIIRGADTDCHDLAPQAAGLLAVSLGLSRMYRDDIAQLDASMMVYDAFYRWSRDAVNETHTWPALSA